LQLRDEDGSWRSLPDADVAPGECCLVAQDAELLQEWLDDLQTAGVASSCVPQPILDLPSWPSLNNTAPPSRDYADRLMLGDSLGRVIDHVTVGEGTGAAPAGRSLERSGLAVWRPATSTAGATPGCPPFVVTADGTDMLILAPNPFHPLAGAGAVSLVFRVPASQQGWELRVYDLWGQLVRDLGGDDLGPGARDVVWDGRDQSGEFVAVGGYVVVLIWRTGGAAQQLACKRLVVVREGAS